MIRRPRSPTLFPYPTLSRSQATDPYGNKFVPAGVRYVSLDTSLCVIDSLGAVSARKRGFGRIVAMAVSAADPADRKSTRLNSSHLVISYAVFCLKKKKAGPSIYPQAQQTNPYSKPHTHRGLPTPSHLFRSISCRCRSLAVHRRLSSLSREDLLK